MILPLDKIEEVGDLTGGFVRPVIVVGPEDSKVPLSVLVVAMGKHVDMKRLKEAFPTLNELQIKGAFEFLKCLCE